MKDHFLRYTPKVSKHTSLKPHSTAITDMSDICVFLHLFLAFLILEGATPLKALVEKNYTLESTLKNETNYSEEFQ